MKKILYIAAAMFTAACAGTADPDNQQSGTPDAFTAPFTLSADKEVVEADGKELVTFSMKDAYGREMLDDKRTLEGINIKSDKGVRVPRMSKTASFIANGEYEFHATFNGVKTVNTVQVVAHNRAKYEVFHKNVGLFKCTSVSCTACPDLGKTLHELTGDVADHSVVLAIHGDYNGPDPFALGVGNMDLGTYLLSYFKTRFWPTLIYDLDKAVEGAVPGSVIESDVMARRIDYPATCGIKVSSVQLEGTALKVEATMKSSTGGEYDLACVVLRDGLSYHGGYSDYNDGIYDRVVVAISDSFLAYNNGRTVEKDAEYSETFSFNFEGSLPSPSELEDVYVAVYAHRKTGGKSIVDNIVTCDYGKTVDYRLND